MNEATLNRLRFRRQFIFGLRAVSLEGEWQTQRFGANWVLTAQRDLPVRRGQAADGAELVLLGFIIDPDCPELNDQQLFERLCQSRGWEEVLQRTVDLSGRWVLFHIAPGQVRVVNDATALRSVYYTVAGQEPWCFSQPGLYRWVRELDYAPGAVEFVNSKESQKDFETCFPVASSPYAEVAHLLANHYLDLNRHTTTRFWPTVPLKPLTLEEAVAQAAPIFQKSMRAITARGTAAFAVTAGRDSRTLLAASREVVNRIWAYTAVHTELNEASPDLRIGTELCCIAGWKYHKLPCPQSMSEPFKRVFMANNDPAHAIWGRICEGMLDTFPSDMIAVRGNVSEVIRCVFYASGVHPAKLEAADLARKCKMPVTEFTCRHFQAWRDEAAPRTGLGYQLLDLLFLEHRMPNWLAISQTEYDIIHDTFSPYSNRRLLSIALAPPAATRIKPQSMIYKELIRHMWPELAPFPFNPPETLQAKWLHKVCKAQRQIGALVGWRPLHVRLEWPGPKPVPGRA
jgi:hypothetical protein